MQIDQTKGQDPCNPLSKHLKSNKPQPNKLNLKNKSQETTSTNYNYKPRAASDNDSSMKRRGLFHAE
jgi:hypothetical protein